MVSASTKKVILRNWIYWFPLAEKNLKFRFPLMGLENLFKNTFRLGGKTENPSQNSRSEGLAQKNVSVST